MREDEREALRLRMADLEYQRDRAQELQRSARAQSEHFLQLKERALSRVAQLENFLAHRIGVEKRYMRFIIVAFTFNYGIALWDAWHGFYFAVGVSVGCMTALGQGLKKMRTLTVKDAERRLMGSHHFVACPDCGDFFSYQELSWDGFQGKPFHKNCPGER